MSSEDIAAYTFEQWQNIAQRELNSAETRLFVDGNYKDAIDGGYKQSGNARDKCIESLLSYTQSKSAWIRLSE